MLLKAANAGTALNQGEKEKIRVSAWIPHVLFLIFTGLLFLLPDSVENDSSIPFFVFVAAIEIAVLILRKNQAARDISSILFIAFTLWELFTAKFAAQPNYLFPTPENIFHIFATDYELILTGIRNSIQLLFWGYLLSIILGVALGILVGWHVPSKEVFLPIAKIITPIPPLVYTPYAIVLMPSFYEASVFIIFCSVFWALFLRMIYTVSGMEQKLLDSVRVLNVRFSTLFFRILLPYCLPNILNGLSLSLSGAFMVLISAEMIGGSAGVGWYTRYYSNYGNYTKVVAGIIVVAVLVTAINALIKLLQKVLVPWERQHG